MRMRESKIITQVLIISAIIMCYLYFQAITKQDKLENDEQISNHDHQSSPQWSREIYDQWHGCVMKNLTHYRGFPETFWKVIKFAIKDCEYILESRLLIEDHRNKDEIKRHITPLNDEPSVIITLGVGHDVNSEIGLKKVLDSRGVKFYGADPMYEINSDLYRQVGTFFNFAVGAQSGIFSLSVLDDGRYKAKAVPVVGLTYFIKDVLKINAVDDIWIDVEGSEYDLFEYFYSDGQLNRNNITICQWNMEIHSPQVEKKKMIHDFLYRLLDDRKYAFARTLTGMHMRLYAINFQDKECVEKYIKRGNNL